MSTNKRDDLAQLLILNQQQTTLLDRSETSSLTTEGRAEDQELIQVKKEANGSELLRIVKVEDHKVLKLEMDASTGTDLGSFEVKEEPVELELQQMNEDICLSGCQQMVKMEPESSSQDDKQDVLKQETDTTMVTVPGADEIKGEPGEQEPQQVKEEEDGPEPQQMVKKEADDLIQDVLKQETDGLNPAASDEEKYHLIILQNFPEAENHQEIKALEASGSSRDEKQQRMSQKTRGQSDDVEKGMKGKEISKDKIWTKEQTDRFIKLRGENAELFTGAKNSASVGWRIILEKMDLSGKVTPGQAKKKWDNLKKKYKECKYPGSGKPTAATWPWFVPMHEVLGQKASICPPVLIASIPTDVPGPSAAGSDKEGDRKPAARKRRRRRDTEQELIDLIREDIRQQREAEERREQESRDRMDRLFSILERLVPK